MNKFRKKGLILMLTLVLALALAACVGGGDTGTPNSQEDEDYYTEISNDTRRVGQEGYGFISIPSYWVNFQNINSPNVDVAFSDPTGSSIINLFLFDDSFEPTTFLSAVALGMHDDGAENISSAIVTLDGMDVYQVYGYYPISGSWLVAWAFTGSDGKLRFITAEAPRNDIVDVVRIIEYTYSNNEW